MYDILLLFKTRTIYLTTNATDWFSFISCTISPIVRNASNFTKIIISHHLCSCVTSWLLLTISTNSWVIEITAIRSTSNPMDKIRFLSIRFDALLLLCKRYNVYCLCYESIHSLFTVKRSQNVSGTHILYQDSR